MAYESLVNAIIGAESGGNPRAQNSKSSAGGLGQFTNSTWLGTLKAHRPDIARGKTDAQLLQLKYDPALSRELTGALASDNAAVLKSRGVEPTDKALSLAHFAGPQGAAAIYANPNGRVEATLSSGAIEANPFLRGKSNADVIAWAGNRISGQSGKVSGPKTEGGAKVMASPGSASGSSAQTAMPGASGSAKLLKANGYDADKLSGYNNIIKVGQDVAGKAQNWQTAVAGIATAGIGGYLKEGEGAKKKELEDAIAEQVRDSKSPIELGKVLSQSPDKTIQAAGLELLAKSLGTSPNIQTVKSRDPVSGQEIETQVTADGQGGYKKLDLVGPAASGAVPQQPPAAPGAELSPEAPLVPPQAQPQPQAAPAPAMQAPQVTQSPFPPKQPGATGDPQLDALSNAAFAQPQQGQQTAPSPAPAPSQPPTNQVPQPGALPADLFEGPPAHQDLIGKENVQVLSPGGRPLYRRLPNGGTTPVIESKMTSDERAKVTVSNEGDVANRSKASQGFSALLGELKMAPQEYGKTAFERAIGPWSASTAQTDNEKGGFWGTGLSVNSIGQGIARLGAEADAAFDGGAAPTEVRDSIETKLLNLATLAKPFVRKPGEGAWTDADQSNLERLVGKASRSKDADEYNRRLDEAERVLSKAFSVKIPRVEAAPKTANAPKTAEEDNTWFERGPQKYVFQKYW